MQGARGVNEGEGSAGHAFQMLGSCSLVNKKEFPLSPLPVQIFYLPPERLWQFGFRHQESPAPRLSNLSTQSLCLIARGTTVEYLMLHSFEF
jgi:hypothetical protein